MKNVTAVMILIKVSLKTINITFCIAVMTTAASGGDGSKCIAIVYLETTLTLNVAMSIFSHQCYMITFITFI